MDSPHSGHPSAVLLLGFKFLAFPTILSIEHADIMGLSVYMYI